MKSYIAIALLSSLVITGCGETPSDLGERVKRELREKKEHFESLDNLNSFTTFLNNQDAWSDDAKKSIRDSFVFAQNISGAVNPEFAGSSIESIEMAIACSITLLNDKREIDLFTSNLKDSVENHEAKVKLISQINNAKNMVANSAINKENCR